MEQLKVWDASKTIKVVLAIVLALMMIPIAVFTQNTKAFANDRQVIFPNGGVATIHDDGTITGVADLQGNYFSSSQHLGKFGTAVMPDGSVLSTACYEILIDDPNHIDYAVPSDGTYGFTATPSGGGYFVLIHSGDADPVGGVATSRGCQRTYTEDLWMPFGAMQLYKSSTDPALTTGSDCYSFAGIQYGVYSDVSCTNLIATLTCDVNGVSNHLDAAPGTYYVREIASSVEGKGYAVDTTVHTVVVYAGQTANINVSDIPQNDPAAMFVGKIDLETTLNMPQGSASLEGAEFTIRYYKGMYDSVEAAENSGKLDRTWVVKTNDKGLARLHDDFKVAGDNFYKSTMGNVIVPLGTLLIQETKAPVGYMLTGNNVELRKVTPEGTVEAVTTFNPPVQKEQVKRGDLEFVKAREYDMARLSGMPFKLTSQTTGESHIIVTDENGYATTNAAWNAHTKDTNKNDNVTDGAYDNESGVWFGRDAEGNPTTPNDEVGALPYDTYTLEELACDANDGLDLITLPDIVVKRNAATVDLGTLDDRTTQNIYLGTTAYDGADLDKNLMADTSAKIIDVVQYMNLARNTEYKLVATLADADTGNMIEVDGKPVSAEVTFTTTDTNDKINVEIPFNSTEYAGRNVVVYERLYQRDKMVSEHADKNDPDQTVRVLSPAITTTATDAVDGDKVIVPSGDAKIKDTITYENLVVGKTYKVEGNLIVKTADENGTVTVQDLTDGEGNAITASAEFTPASASGKTDVVFDLAGTTLEDNSQIVVFETLYLGDKVIAEHADADDIDQTVIATYPSIETTATDGDDGDKSVVADATSKVVDKVSYQNLTVGTEYELVALVMDKDNETAFVSDAPVSEYNAEGVAVAKENAEDVTEGEVKAFTDKFLGAFGIDTSADMSTFKPKDIDVDALAALEADPMMKKVAVAKHTFTPQTVNGDVNVDITFDTSAMIQSEDKREAVVYEMLVSDGKLIAAHTDINDGKQTFEVIPSTIRTTATDATDGDHEVLPSKECKVVDTISYEGLIAGHEYVATGKLIVKETSEELFIDDKPITANVRFIPNASVGTVDVEFTFDSTNLIGTELVAFESVEKNDIEVAVHADINDEAQSVVVKEAPKGSGFYKTGGFGALSMIVLAGLGAATIWMTRRYSNALISED